MTVFSDSLSNALFHYRVTRRRHLFLFSYKILLYKVTASSLRSPVVPVYCEFSAVLVNLLRVRLFWSISGPVPKNPSTMVVNAVGKFLYRGVFSRASTSVLGVIVGAFFLERSCAEIADYVFDNANKGVSVLLWTWFMLKSTLTHCFALHYRNSGRTSSICMKTSRTWT